MGSMNFASIYVFAWSISSYHGASQTSQCEVDNKTLQKRGSGNADLFLSTTFNQKHKGLGNWENII